MGGKTLPQFSIPPADDRRRPGDRQSAVRPRSSGTTRVGRQELAIEAARGVVRAAREESAVLPRRLAESLEALADSLVALEKRPSTMPPRSTRPSEPATPTLEMPAAVEAWWQIEAAMKAGETRYVARWFEAVGPDGAVVAERECDGLSDSLQTVLGRNVE